MGGEHALRVKRPWHCNVVGVKQEAGESCAGGGW